MLALFECIGQAVMNKGVRGLAELVPGGPYVFDIAGDAYRLFRDRRRADQLRDEVVKVAAASAEDAKRAAEEVARKVAGSASVEDRITLELYLTQIPGCVRQSLKRADDPAGQSVPAAFSLNGPEELARLLPPCAPRFRPGTELPGRPGWHLVELLGAGGFGEVWLARHTFIPNPRAVKFCTDPLAKAKLTSHEGKVISRVMAHGHHPNVVPLVDAVLDGEWPWLMYEYVGGGSLTDLVHRWQSLPPDGRARAAADALHELAAAVGTFHRLDPPIVHRDLKPSNILVGTTTALRITDFGIGGVAVEYARTHTPTGRSLMTGWLETSLRGSYTPLYASPQQQRGEAPDPRDDVHALGVMGYQMLTGRLDQAPGSDAADDLQEAGVGAGLIAVLLRCVAQRPERRPKDAGELSEKLAELRGTKPLAASPPAKPQAAPPPSKPPSFQKGPLDGGAVAFTPKATPAPVAAEARPEKWLIPFRAIWSSRPTTDAAANWTPQPGRLPGEAVVRPSEAYRLSFPAEETADATLAKLWALAQIPGLEAIDLSGCARVTDAGCAHLTALPGLKAVALAGTAVTDSGVSLLLNRFPNLEAVGLAGMEGVSAAVVPYLARMRKLKAVSLPPRVNSVDVRRELARRLPSCQVL